MAPKGNAASNSKVVTQAQVRAMINGKMSSQFELKRFNAVFTGLVPNAAGTVTPVTQGIVQGDTAITRDGNCAFVKEFVFRHRLVAAAGATVTQRIIVFADTMADNAIPTVVDVLDTASYLSGFQVADAQARRFHILHDSYVLSSSSGANWSHSHVVRMKVNRRVVFNAATNVAGANGRNAIFVLFIADANSGTYDGGFEVTFTDA